LVIDLDFERKRIQEAVERAIALVNDVRQISPQVARSHLDFYISEARAQADEKKRMVDFLTQYYEGQDLPNWVGNLKDLTNLWNDGVAQLEQHRGRFSA
jgi:hypothetical protein